MTEQEKAQSLSEMFENVEKSDNPESKETTEYIDSQIDIIFDNIWLDSEKFRNLDFTNGDDVEDFRNDLKDVLEEWNIDQNGYEVILDLVNYLEFLSMEMERNKNEIVNLISFRLDDLKNGLMDFHDDNLKNEYGIDDEFPEVKDSDKDVSDKTVEPEDPFEPAPEIPEPVEPKEVSDKTVEPEDPFEPAPEIPDPVGPEEVTDKTLEPEKNPFEPVPEIPQPAEVTDKTVESDKETSKPDQATPDIVESHTGDSEASSETVEIYDFGEWDWPEYNADVIHPSDPEKDKKDQEHEKEEKEWTKPDFYEVWPSDSIWNIVKENYGLTDNDQIVRYVNAVVENQQEWAMKDRLINSEINWIKWNNLWVGDKIKLPPKDKLER